MSALLDRLRPTSRTGADIQPFASTSFANRRLKPRPWPPVQHNSRSRRRNPPASEGDVAVDAWLVRLNARLQRLDRVEELDHSSDQTSGLPTDRTDPDISSPQVTLLCSICFEVPTKFPEASPTAHCIHPPNICAPCLDQYVSHAVLDRGSIVPRCPGLECTQTMAYADILRAVNGNTDCLDRYESLVLRSTLSREPRFIWCKNPACDWGQVHKDKSASQIVTCRGCGARACFAHDAPWHVGLTCEEYDTKTGRVDPASKKYIEDHTKKCPNKSCGRPIEKISGCDHMTCRLPGGCGHEFCWVCLTDYATIRKKGMQSHNPTCRYHPRFRRSTTTAHTPNNPPPIPVPPRNQPTRPVGRRLVERVRSAVRRLERPAPPVVNVAPAPPDQPVRPRSVLQRLAQRIRPRRPVHPIPQDMQVDITRPINPIPIPQPAEPVVVAFPVPATVPPPNLPSHPRPLVVSRPVERMRPAITRPIDPPVMCQVPTPTNRTARPSVAKRIAGHSRLLVPRRRVRSLNPLVIVCWLFWGSGIGTTSLILCVTYLSLLVFGDTKLANKGCTM